MKKLPAFITFTLVLGILILGACAPTVSTPVGDEIAVLPPTELPVILPTDPIVYAPQVAIAPTSGQSGTLIQVSASGYMPNMPVSVWMGPLNSEAIQVAQGMTHANGSFSAQIPVQGAAGMDFVVYVAHEDQQGAIATDRFHVVEVSQPSVSIFPPYGESGTLVQVVASGFPSNTHVTVGMGPANSGFGQVAEGSTDGNGVFIAEVAVQGSLGMQFVFAVSAENQPGVLSPEQFQITGAVPNPQPVPPTPTPYLDMWSIYSNPAFGISLEYPSEWQPIPGYGSPETGELKYGGINGFFHVNAMDTDTIDMAAAAEAGHKLQPYGTNPIIESLQIQRQEARLILPSEGQQFQAAIIIRYPQPVNISGTPCRFFILWADQAHIRTLAQTIQFTQ